MKERNKTQKFMYKKLSSTEIDDVEEERGRMKKN